MRRYSLYACEKELALVRLVRHCRRVPQVVRLRCMYPTRRIVVQFPYRVREAPTLRRLAHLGLGPHGVTGSVHGASSRQLELGMRGLRLDLA